MMDFNNTADMKLAEHISSDTERQEQEISNSDTLDNQIDSIMQNELNSSNFERSINIAFNHLTQMINLNNADCMLNLNSATTISSDQSGSAACSDSDLGLPILKSQIDLGF